MITIIAGCRDCVDPWELEAALISCPFKITAVICGEAQGIDSLGKEWAEYHGLPVHSAPANWDDLEAPGAIIRTNRFGKKYNARAGTDRNMQMLDHPAEALLAIWDGKSRGTANMIAISKARGILVHVHFIGG